MIGSLILLIGILIILVSVATLMVAILTLQSSRRSEEIGKDRTELLRDQQGRLQLLREEREMLIRELEHTREERSGSRRKIEHLEANLMNRERDLLPELRPSEPLKRESWWVKLLQRQFELTKILRLYNASRYETTSPTKTRTPSERR